jgi:hypothetical protein
MKAGSFRTRRFWYVLPAILALGAAVRAAAPVPPAAGHPKMQVAAAAQKLHDHMSDVTQDAAKKGNYVCCINPPCEFCAVHMAACPCGKNLAAGKPVCRECKGGWEVGEGRVQGVKPADVKGMSAQDVMKMMHH